jgi:tRNA (cmo5U34)-methyltransferase
MLNRASKKAKAFGVEIDLVNADLHDVSFDDAKLILSNYTLQFIRPLQREKLVKKIYDSLQDGGIFIFSEKVISSNSTLNKQSLLMNIMNLKKHKVTLNLKYLKKEKLWKMC